MVLIKQWLKEPLVHFMLLGMLIFVVYQWRQPELESSPIVVTTDTVEQLANQYRKTWLQEPSKALLEQAVNNHVATQLYAEQAFAMDMHKDDSVVARRMRMKMELLEGLFVAEPTRDEVEEYFKENLNSYIQNRKMSFEHRYFNSPRQSQEWQDMLQQLARGVTVTSDPSMYQDEYDEIQVSRLVRGFGSAFVAFLSDQPLGEWAGPFRSPSGWHIVRLNRLEDPIPPKLDTIFDQVAEDTLRAKREAAKQDALEKLLANHSITIEWPTQYQPSTEMSHE